MFTSRTPYKFLDSAMPPFIPNPANTNLGNYKLPPLPNLGNIPKLPLIADKDLERQVFTHSSYVQKARKATSLELGEIILDNEKLEHVGDSIINATVALLLHQLFPRLQVGGATILKGHLVSNLSLSQLSNYYNLPSRLIAPATDLWTLRSGEKIQANIFEAYVAALYMSYLESDITSSLPLESLSITPTPLNPPSRSQSAPLQDPSPSPFKFPSPPSPSTADAEGRAFAKIGYWLKPLFSPLCHWVLMEVQNEQKRLDEVQCGNKEDSHVDMLAVGATARLNEYMLKFHGNAPVYPASRAGTENWLVACTCQDKEGRLYTAQATRATKKLAGNIAAYKICQEMGL